MSSSQWFLGILFRMVPWNFLNPSSRLSSPVGLPVAFFLLLFHWGIRVFFALTTNSTSPQEGRWSKGRRLAWILPRCQFCRRHLSRIALFQRYSILVGDTLVPTLQMRRLRFVFRISSQEIIPKPSCWATLPARLPSGDPALGSPMSFTRPTMDSHRIAARQMESKAGYRLHPYVRSR